VVRQKKNARVDLSYLKYKKVELAYRKCVMRKNCASHQRIWKASSDYQKIEKAVGQQWDTSIVVVRFISK
jgi:hypothetical protein